TSNIACTDLVFAAPDGSGSSARGMRARRSVGVTRASLRGAGRGLVRPGRVGGDRPRPPVVGLPGRGPLDAVDPYDRLGELVAGDVPCRLLEEVLVAGLDAVAQLDEGDHLAAPAGRGPSRDDAVRDRRVVQHGALDLLGEHLLATGVDRHRVAPVELDRAVRGEV